jgi:hypothetical protein
MYQGLIVVQEGEWGQLQVALQASAARSSLRFNIASKGLAAHFEQTPSPQSSTIELALLLQSRGWAIEMTNASEYTTDSPKTINPKRLLFSTWFWLAMTHFESLMSRGIRAIFLDMPIKYYEFLCLTDGDLLRRYKDDVKGWKHDMWVAALHGKDPMLDAIVSIDPALLDEVPAVEFEEERPVAPVLAIMDATPL